MIMEHALYVSILFLSLEERDKKDLDNLPKILLDSLQGVVFKNDNQIDHLDLIKFRWGGDEDYIHINIGESTTNRHEDVLYHGILHSWGGQEELRLEDFIET